ncbi:hypothetical protein ACIBJE_25175 [Micromonospora sp. NPDC050187]|uniref:hypothetical protein n=1 Tax=Micromonospora sp. NPDC050187 TaxID=3364277 RepID=UPI0037AF158A
MTDPNPPVRLILDRSALVAYAVGSMHAAEPIHQVVENQARIGVSVAALSDTLAQLDDPQDRAALNELVGSDACEPLPVHADTWQELAYWQRVTGRLDLAAGVLAVIEHDCWILTAEPKLYGDGIPLVEIPDL